MIHNYTILRERLNFDFYEGSEKQKSIPNFTVALATVELGSVYKLRLNWSPC